MPPAKARAAHDDAITGTKEKHSTTNARGRRNGIAGGGSALKDVVSSSTLANNATDGHNSQGASGGSGFSWPNEEVQLLHGYRNLYRLDVPSAFHSPLNQALLTNPGIGRHSPTMARRKVKTKIDKDQLALAVRKHFNGLAVSEPEVIVDMMYKIRSNEKSFRMKFAPSRNKKE
ncbi:hypothetical protein EV356DRAFT_574591 [Viridothelium virens]|uniref:Histone deacetylase complex subunit SAP30 Sin3 binding domain-containing protein n=1 Tax=Viridothelium virens TaxID=1048519 RepID=A0A6A6HGN6_VIRVR|nr:hypothetical protein EV356DRAFT_574591 [Viridothelium virens]